MATLPKCAIALTLLLSVALPVYAQVYKCPNSDGTTSFSDKPCPDTSGRPRTDPKVTRPDQSPTEAAARERKAMIDKWESELKAELAKRAAEEARRARQPTNASQTAAPDSTSTTMSFEQCVATVTSTIRRLNAAPRDVRQIVRTNVMTMTRICTADGSVLITCSQPDSRMVTTVSSGGAEVGCR